MKERHVEENNVFFFHATDFATLLPILFLFHEFHKFCEFSYFLNFVILNMDSLSFFIN